MSDVILAALVGVLALMNAFQLWFWFRETHRLVDKIMSRNYPEYVSTNAYRAHNFPVERKSLETTTVDVSDDDVLKELNGMLGL